MRLQERVIHRKPMSHPALKRGHASFDKPSVECSLLFRVEHKNLLISLLFTRHFEGLRTVLGSMAIGSSPYTLRGVFPGFTTNKIEDSDARSAKPTHNRSADATFAAQQENRLASELIAAL